MTQPPDGLPELPDDFDFDAEFARAFGPRTPDGEDTYLLCEVNVSCVFPIPDESVPSLVAVAIERVRAAREARAR